MQLSTEVKTHIVIFKDNSKKWIKDSVYQNLLSLGENGKFSVDGGIYDYNMVSKVLTKEEYYLEYPNDRPQVYNSGYKESPPMNIKLDHPRKRQLILQGIENAVGKNEFYQGVEKIIRKKDYLVPSQLIK